MEAAAGSADMSRTRRVIVPPFSAAALVGADGVGDAKYPEISTIKCVGLEANALINPFVVGMIAMLELTAPSNELSVEARGCGAPCGHKVRNPSPPGGTTVAFST